MSESIFGADQAPVASEVVTPSPTQPDQLPPEVLELVGEGKKYRNAADALKSIPHAQSHIAKLEEEADTLRKELERAKAMEDLLEEFKRQGSVPASASPQAPASAPKDPVDIDSKVEEILQRKQAEAVAKQNANTVVEAFKKSYGEEAEGRFVKLSEEVGLPVEVLNQLAMTSPEAVMKLAGIKKDSAVARPTSSVNTAGQFNSNQQELSAKVPMVGASTKDVLNAWRIAGIKAQQNS
jgi:hypothetical protein